MTEAEWVGQYLYWAGHVVGYVDELPNGRWRARVWAPTEIRPVLELEHRTREAAERWTTSHALTELVLGGYVVAEVQA